MKKRILTSAIFTLIAIPLLANCHTNQTVTRPLIYEVTDAGLFSLGMRTSYSFFDGSSVPYKSVSLFVNEFLNFAGQECLGITSISVETSGNKSTFTNQTTGGTAVMNYDTQTIYYADVTKYLSDSNNPNMPVGCDIGGNQFFKETTSQRGAPVPYTINLKDYNLRGYLINGEGYLPEAVMMNVLAPFPWVGIIYNGKGCYLTPGSGNKDTFYRLMKSIAKEATIFNAGFMEYNYNVLALMFDFRFGLAGEERDCRNTATYEPDKKHHFFSKAADVLKKYKTDICSKNKITAALTDFKINELDDGGHSFYYASNVFTSFNESKEMRERESYGKSSIHGEGKDEYSHTIATLNSLMTARAKTQYDPGKMTGGDAAFKICKNQAQTKKVAYITFDSFTDAGAAGTVDPTKIDETNYFLNSISLIYYANKIIRENDDIHNILINLSCNGGGAVYVSEFITSWLCGSSKMRLYNRLDKTTRTLERKADINLDGSITSADFLDSSQYNVYFIISNGSFSCGNLLPCQIKDYYPTANNVHFFGTQTGGGCCSVSSINCDALGNNFILSSLYTLLRKEGKVTVESGVEPDYTQFTTDAEYFDIAKIIEDITTK